MQGQGEEGIAQMRQGLASYRTLGMEVGVTICLSVLAESYAAVEQLDEALCALDEAFVLLDKTGERIDESEIYRLKGELLYRKATGTEHEVAEAEKCFLTALDVAREQRAKSWELRTATSLAHLWQQQGKIKEGYELLAPVYEWFTEGLDTADFQDAKALLDELRV